MKILSLLLAVPALLSPAADAFSPISSIKSTSRSTSLYSSSTSTTTQTLQEGLTKTILTPGNPSQPLRFGDIATVSYNVKSASTNQIISKATKQKIVIGDGIMISGFEIGLNSMSVGESSRISIIDAAQFGYGVEGIPPILGSNESLDIELTVLDTEEQSKFGTTGMGGDVSAVSGMTGSGELGALDPMKPRTPEAIAAAYAVRQEQMMFEKQNEKEGLEAWIEKAKEFYFFGFFEGETGEKTPWILRPSITFPIAFAFVGVGFYITFAVGGISERGSQIKDELDDIVLSYNIMKDTISVVTLALLQK